MSEKVKLEKGKSYRIRSPFGCGTSVYYVMGVFPNADGPGSTALVKNGDADPVPMDAKFFEERIIKEVKS